MFYHLTVTDSSNTYSFHIERQSHPDDPDIVYYIGNRNDQRSSCVVLVVDRETWDAHIDGVSYHKNCSVTRNLDSHQGTICMIQGALQFLVSMHPMITRVDLCDLAVKELPNMTIQITPRRILLGKPGWYEEHMQAVPEKKTRQLLERLRHISILDKPGWGSRADIEKILYEQRVPVPSIRQLFGTMWYIPTKHIKKYSVSITYKETDRIGGAKTKKVSLASWVAKRAYKSIYAKYDADVRSMKRVQPIRLI